MLHNDQVDGSISKEAEGSRYKACVFSYQEVPHPGEGDNESKICFLGVIGGAPTRACNKILMG